MLMATVVVMMFSAAE